jgi:hypothetical protein
LLKNKYQFELELYKAKYGRSNEREYDHLGSWEVKKDLAVTESAIAWAKKHCLLDEESFYSGVPEYLLDQNEGHTSPDTPADLAQALPLIFAWLLDYFLEMKEPGWKQKLSNPQREPSDWLRGNNIKRKPVNSAIASELDLEPNESIENIARTVDKDVKAAEKTIKSDWLVSMPLTKKKLPGAYRSIYGLVLACIGEEQCSEEQHIDLAAMKDDSDQAARFLSTRYPLPPGLHSEIVESCLRHIWP